MKYSDGKKLLENFEKGRVISCFIASVAFFRLLYYLTPRKKIIKYKDSIIKFAENEDVNDYIELILTMEVVINQLPDKDRLVFNSFKNRLVITDYEKAIEELCKLIEHLLILHLCIDKGKKN
ncbi:MAG: hypothetical protein K9M99_04850 [Candidatus Cloacimonetes bacterium]|nr:hypothetical protein [Candidatus Cloacimonadota bacterium]